MSALLGGIHNIRYPQPKYVFIWDVEVVVYLDSIDQVESIDTKSLTLKVTVREKYTLF